MFKLRDYQKKGGEDVCKLLQTLKVAVLVWQPRCGKTLAALESANLYGAKNVLFVTKKIAIKSIEGDYKKAEYKFYLKVINYESLHLVNEDYDLIIADECHTLSSFPKPAERTKLLKTICNGKPVILVSATITPESYSQVYHEFFISSFSPFAEYSNFYKWAKDFVNVKKRYVFNRELNDYSNAKEIEIKKIIGKYLITRTQKESGFNQEIDEKVLPIEMNKSTYWLANKILKDRVHIAKDGAEVIADTEVKLKQKLHQIFSGTVKCEDGTIKIFDTSKAEFIKQYFVGKKIAIFYQYIGEGEMIKSVFKNTTNSPEIFNERNDLVFISQIQAGREGVNLATADCLVMFNIGYSSVSYQQAKERIQDKNRTKSANLYWVFTTGGIEYKIYEVVKNKLDYSLKWFKKDFGIQSKKQTT